MKRSGPVGRGFYQRDPVTCAHDLIGCRLQWGDRSGIVVETEAYDAEGDEACHTFFRPSAREFVAEHQVGTAYVYFNYGMHWMLNALVKGKREGFVLIRALEPLEGIEKMQRARKQTDIRNLCSGPGKLAQACGITGAHHGMDLCADPEFGFYYGEKLSVRDSPRIGITRAVELPWRFYAESSPHVSGKRLKAGRGRPPSGLKSEQA